MNDIDELRAKAIEWALALDKIHKQVFIGQGPHPELEAFQQLEKELHDLALASQS